VVGISTAILARRSEGIGFAIASNDARFVAESLMRRGKVTRGYLGVQSEDLCRYSNTQRHRLAPGALGGAVVTKVLPNTPADRSGIRKDDVIVAVDGRSIESQSMLRNRVARIPPLTQVRVLLVRDGQEREIPAVLGEFPTPDRDG
jgi:serine protease Do